LNEKIENSYIVKNFENLEKRENYEYLEISKKSEKNSENLVKSKNFEKLENSKKSENE
jgi:hypothetical protein